MNVLTFKPMPGHERGTILRILQESYQGLPQVHVDLITEWEKDWKRFDDDIFNHPDSIGASCFITYRGASIIGFASWDPRQHPTAIIGHNCILSPFRRNGYGRRQIEEILRRLRASGFTRARVTTGDHPAFTAAQEMYLACGFHEIRRFSSATEPHWRLVEFEKDLSSHCARRET